MSVFSWFRKKRSDSANPIEVTVTGINPQTENEFLFFDFVEREPVVFLKEWYKMAKAKNYSFKTNYEKAILDKIRNGRFINPHTFPEYFNSQFDYIAIDFEIANKNRISACAIGLVFIKNKKVAYRKTIYIKPPDSQVFSDRHTAIHGITFEDVENALNFKELWDEEFFKYFNRNLILFHNASMDLSVLKNLFEYYDISGFEIRYLDTMQLAGKLGKPKKLTELARFFDIEFSNSHDPKEDAYVCALVFEELIDLNSNYSKYIKSLSYSEVKAENHLEQSKKEIDIQNLSYIQKYALDKDELDFVIIEDQGFVFTGDISIERHVAKEFIQERGGLIKTSISRNVNYVVLGVNYGWSKIQKVHELNEEKNCKIKILSNFDFEYLLEKYAK